MILRAKKPKALEKHHWIFLLVVILFLLAASVNLRAQGTLPGIGYGPALPPGCNSQSASPNPVFYLTTVSGASQPGLYTCKADGTYGAVNTGGGTGSVTHTGNLTLNSLLLGNGVADAKIDTGCGTNGAGALSCTSLTSTTSISVGSGASAAGTNGGIACAEAASTGWTPTAGQDYKRCDSTLHTFVDSINGSSETPAPVFSAVPAGSKCLQSSGVAGLIAEAAGACGTGAISGLTTGTLPKAASPTTLANSLCDEAITTANALTCTNTAGIRSPAFTSTGTRAVFVDYPQGTDSGAVAPCNAATSICWEAPTVVTAYKGIFPGVAATGIPHYANAANVITETISAINLAGADVTGALPIGNVGSAGLSGTAPITINAAGAIGCATCGSAAFPVTVSGTVVSGAMPYFNSTTQESSSALLATNALIVGGGVGGAPATGNADFTYATHTLTGAAAALFDMSAATTASAFKIPVGAGLTAAANGVLAYDTTAGATHVRSNAADSLAAAEAAAIVANTVPKATNSTNSLITASSMIDNGTSVTSTDTGGFIAPVFTSNGPTAGFVDYPQGTTSAAVAPCNAATSICRQAPAAVTSYVLNFAAAAPVNSNSAELFSNANPGVGTFAKMPQTAITSGSAYTNATTTFSNVVGGSGQTLQLTVEANTNYVLNCQILWSASGATAGPKFQFTGPGSPTAVQYSVVQAVTATTDGTAGATAFSTSLNASGATVVTGTNEPAELSLGLVNGANAGTVILQAAAQGAGTVTIQPGSYCQGQ